MDMSGAGARTKKFVRPYLNEGLSLLATKLELIR